jgi:hypothetical protein
MAKYALLILKSHKGFDGLLQPFLSHFIFFIHYLVASGYTVYDEADGYNGSQGRLAWNWWVS